MRKIWVVSLLFGALLISPLVYADQGQENFAQSLTHYTMGLIHDFRREPQEAIKEYQLAAQFDGDSYAIPLHQAIVYTDLGLTSQAIEVLKKVESMRLEETQAQYILELYLGINYISTGQLSFAIKYLQSAAERRPSDMHPRYLLALAYSSKKEFEKSAAEYEFILKNLSSNDPENASIYGYLGQLYYSQGKYLKAIEQFNKMLAIEPNNADVLYLLGSLYLETEDRGKAIDTFKKAIKSDPLHEGSLNSLGYMYAEEGIHLDEALDMVKRAVELSPNNGAYLDSLGWVYYKKGLYHQALESLLKADSVIKDSVVFEHLGDVYLKLNEFEKAKKYWRLALELSPNQATILQKINELNQGESKEVLTSTAPTIIK